MSYLIVLTLQSSQRLPKESYRTCSRSIGKNCFCNISESWPLQYAGFWWLWPFLLQVHNEFFNKWPKQKASSENRSIFSPYAKWRSTGCNTHLWRRDLMLFFLFLGFCLCCCRCAGKCGAYPEHFDKRGDACKRASLGVILSIFVIAAMFGVVTAFVTNQYAHEGLMMLPKRLQRAADDTSLYLDNTGQEVNTLLVSIKIIFYID